MLEKIGYSGESDLESIKKPEKIKICFCPINTNFCQYKTQIDQQIKTLFREKNNEISPRFIKKNEVTIDVNPTDLDKKPNNTLIEAIKNCSSIQKDDHILFNIVEELDYLKLPKGELFCDYYQDRFIDYITAVRHTIEEKTGNRLSIYFTYIIKNADGNNDKIVTHIPKLYQDGSLKSLI